MFEINYITGCFILYLVAIGLWIWWSLSFAIRKFSGEKSVWYFLGMFILISVLDIVVFTLMNLCLYCVVEATLTPIEKCLVESRMDVVYCIPGIEQYDYFPHQREWLQKAFYDFLLDTYTTTCVTALYFKQAWAYKLCGVVLQ